MHEVAISDDVIIQTAIEAHSERSITYKHSHNMYIPKLFLNVLQWPGNEASIKIYCTHCKISALFSPVRFCRIKLKKKQKLLIIYLAHNPETHI